MDRYLADTVENKMASIYSKDEIAHITKTMRMKVGDLLEVFDGQSKEYIGRIHSIEKDRILIDITQEISIQKELEANITLYQGIPKSQKMDLIIQKVTEIGANRIVPIKFERNVRVIDEKEDKQIIRWQKIAQEAAKQSKRLVIPKIEKSLTIEELLNDMNSNDINILFYENETGETFKQVLQKVKQEVRNPKIGLIIGSEGGITEKEVHLLIDNGAYSVTLGNRILRTETAAIYGASAVAYEFS